MAKSDHNRWQRWVSGGSRSNPDGKQRDCDTCGMPFVYQRDSQRRCDPCRRKYRSPARLKKEQAVRAARRR